MSVTLRAVIQYDLPYTHDRVRPLFEATAEVVEENRQHRDQWTEDVQQIMVDVDKWMLKLESETWQKGFYKGEPMKFNGFPFHFTRLNLREAWLFIETNEEQDFVVVISISSHIIDEVEGDRELHRMRKYEKEHPEILEDDDWWDKKSELTESEWIGPFLVSLLRRVVERLLLVYPIRETVLNPWLDPAAELDSEGTPLIEKC